MKFSTEERVKAPADWVFARLSDVPSIERAGRRRGARVERVGEGHAAGEGGRPVPGAAWKVGFDLRGKRYDADAALTAFDPPREIRIEGDSRGLRGAARITVTPEGDAACRVAVALDLAASGMGAKAVLQTLKLARGPLGARFERAVEDTAHALSYRYAGGA